MDPRVRASGVTEADLEEQFALNRRILDAIGTARATKQAVDSVRATLRTAVEEGERNRDDVQGTLDQLDALYKKLATSTEGSYPPPKLIDQLEYLYFMTTEADQKLGTDAFTRFETLQSRLETIRAEWAELEDEQDLP